MEDSLSSDIQAKRQAIDAMLQAQLPPRDQKSFLSHAAMETGMGGKEAVLRKLLGTQDTYIRELESKCKAMAAQLMPSDPDYNNRQDVPILSQQKLDRVDLVDLETSSNSSGEKLAQVIHVLQSTFATVREGPTSETPIAEYSHPVAGNLVAALQMITNQVHLEDQVSQQRTQQHASLISAMQNRFQKERDDHKALFEKNEQDYEQRILSLEQEIIVYKQHVRTFSQDKQTAKIKQDLNAGVIEQMENLESKFQQSEEELRDQNKELRRQVQEAQLNEREAAHQIKNIKQSLNLTETDQFACLKRIECQMKVIAKEFKLAQSKLAQSSQVQDNRDLRVEKVLSTLNKQIQALDDELEQEFDAIVHLQSTHHKQELLGSPSEKQLQILLRDAERENITLKQQMQIAELSEQEKTQSVWVSKLELSNNEKKAIQSELKKLVDISSKRETMLNNENASLIAQISQLKESKAEREQLLLSEISTLKSQLAQLLQQLRQTGNSLNQSAIQGSLESQQIARDISSQFSTANQGLLESRDNELNFIRNLNENLQRQLKEANQLLCRSNTFEKQNGIGLIYNKLEVRFQDVIRQIQASLVSLEEIAAKNITRADQPRKQSWMREQEHQEKVFELERQVFEERERVQQLRSDLDQAKVCLVQSIQEGQQDNSRLDDTPLDQEADPNLVDMLVTKFSTEIEKLKVENSQLRLQRDDVTQFYKDEFAQLWKKVEDGSKRSSLRDEQANQQARQDEIRAVLCQLEEKLSDLQSWISQLRVEEIKALQEKVSMLHSKHLQQKLFTPKLEPAQRPKTKQPTPRVTEYSLDPAAMARNESNFSFNNNAQRNLLYEEIELLRDQVAQYSDNYVRATQSRDAQFQVLAKERNILRSRETQLDGALQDAIDVVSACDGIDKTKVQWEREQELKEVKFLRAQNQSLLERFTDEKEANEQELEQVQSSYQDKFIQLKERETLLELQLAQVDKDLKASQESLMAIREHKDETVSSLNGEIASLKKFANQRQAELLEARRQVALFYKKTKESIAMRELELKRTFKEQVGGHVKVLEIEIQKLVKGVQKN